MAHIEKEAWGLTYERYALEQLLRKMAKEYSLREVAEMPAHGVKAMPSIYSIGFGLAGCFISLINGDKAYIKEWKALGLDKKVEFVDVNSLYQTNINSNSFDLVWNFAYLSICDEQDLLFEEMKRISKKYIAIFSVNAGNIGFPVHRLLHKINRVPWTHGAIKYNSMRNVESYFSEHGVKVIEKGFVDTPPWPDSLGFRDMRLHKSAKILKNANWISPYIYKRQNNKFPLWIKLLFLFERVPVPFFIKTIYSHIFYVVGEVD
jgi:hypothetical protein